MRTTSLRIYDPVCEDYDFFQSINSELMELASVPLTLYTLNLQPKFTDSKSGIDSVWNEVDIQNEELIGQRYSEGFTEEFSSELIQPGEVFNKGIPFTAYFADNDISAELSRMGFPDVQEELTVYANYRKMLSEVKREVAIGDVLKTFRNKLYRVTGAFPDAQTVGWKYLQFKITAVVVPPDTLVLPDDTMDHIIRDSGHTGI
jgi:hypothetical protein